MRPRLLYTYLRPTSFVRDDLALLGDAFDVVPHRFDVGTARGVGAALALARASARQAAWLRAEGPRAAGLVGWFADYHLVLPSLWARATGKPVGVVVGGYDANTVPSLHYGAGMSRWRAPLVRSVLGQASALFPVTPSVLCDENRFAEPPGVLQTGLCVTAPEAAKRAHVVPLGVSPDAWPMGAPERPPGVLTVAVLQDARTLRVKGIDLLVAAARSMPQVRFDVVGFGEAFRPEAERLLQPPENVAFHPGQDRSALAAWYGRASVYAQLSRVEAGLPMVLAEAMLCGCVPVGSRVGGIPLTIGEEGELVSSPDPAEIVDALTRALRRGPEARARARGRVADRFSLAQRQQRLTEAVAAMLA